MRFIDQSVNPEALLRDLDSPDPQVRCLAADALSRVGEEHRPRAGAALRALLHDEHSQIRYTAALSLGELGDDEALEALIEQVEGDGNPMARQAAVIALGLIGDARAAPYLIKALKSDNPDVRFQSVTSLMQVSPEQAKKPLRRALKDEDPEVRAGAVAAMGDLGDPHSVAIIAPMLDDLTSGVQFEAAMTLARLGDRRGTELLLRHLQLKQTMFLAAEHLYRCPDPRAIDPLNQILGRWLAPPLLKVWAAGALAKLEKPEGKAKLLTLIQSRHASVKGTCIQILGELGEPWAREALTELHNSSAGADWQEEIQDALEADAGGGPARPSR